MSYTNFYIQIEIIESKRFETCLRNVKILYGIHLFKVHSSCSVQSGMIRGMLDHGQNRRAEDTARLANLRTRGNTNQDSAKIGARMKREIS